MCAHAAKRKFTPPSEGKFRSLAWSDDETLLITLSVFSTFGSGIAANHFEMYRTYAADINTGKATLLLMGEGARQLVTGARMLAWRTSRPGKVIMSTLDFSAVHAKEQTGTRISVGRKDEGWISQVFEVDTRTGKGKRIEAGTAFTLDWVVNRDGEPVARSEWNPAQSLFTILAKAGGGWREIFRETDNGGRDVYGLTSDESALIISAVTSDGRRRLWKLPLDGSAGTPLLPDAASDISDVNYDSITGTPVSVSLGGPEQGVHWLDAEAEKQYARVARAFKGKRVAVYGRSTDGKRMLAYVDTPSSPPVYYFIDFAQGTADIVGEAYPGLIDATLGEVRVISYPARDGAMVPAYLTIPPGSNGKNLPLVVLPHGGPEARDDYAFDWWAQFLAVRGYAVLQPQFRGSTGFGNAWRRAGYRQWGGLMQDDVTDGVKAMIEQGIANAERICIVGASYGGYAALAGAAFTPKLYRCA